MERCKQGLGGGGGGVGGRVEGGKEGSRGFFETLLIIASIILSGFTPIFNIDRLRNLLNSFLCTVVYSSCTSI